MGQYAGNVPVLYIANLAWVWVSLLFASGLVGTVALGKGFLKDPSLTLKTGTPRSPLQGSRVP